VYYHIFLALSEPEEVAHYFRLSQVLETNHIHFPREEARTLYNFAQNYCIRKANSGRSEFLEELFGLYRFLLQSGLILEEGYLTQWDYKNAITVGLRLNNVGWTEQFIHEYKDQISPAFRENAFNYNLSNFYFETNELGKALQLLQSVEFTDVYYNLSARSLLLKIYYQQGDTEALYALSEAFKVFLKRNKLVSQYQSKVHLNLIKLVKKTHKLRLKKPRRITEGYQAEMDELATEIAATREITNVNWLKEKLNELRG